LKIAFLKFHYNNVVFKGGVANIKMKVPFILVQYKKLKRVSDWLLFNGNSALSWRDQVNFQWNDDEVRINKSLYIRGTFIFIDIWFLYRVAQLSPFNFCIELVDSYDNRKRAVYTSHWHDSPRIDMPPYSDTLSWFRINSYLLFLLNAVCLAEKQHILIK
jgi:hypothetical protein